MRRLHLFEDIGRFGKSLWRDTSGIVLPYVTVMLAVIVGVSLLALDGARYMSLQTQMQSAADALALAGAAELNRAPGARARATLAIDKLITNGLSGMGVTAAVQASSINYYENLPPATQALSNGTIAPDDGHARFVAVTVTPVTVPTILPVSFLNLAGANSYTGKAQAVAGFDEIACKYTPMFVCNPYETAQMTYDQATAALENASSNHDLVALQGASNAQYFPGNFGWVQAPVTTTAANECGSGNSTAQEVAQSQPLVCFSDSAINTQTGNIANTDDALNTRFDLYAKSFNGCAGNSLYPPAPNVRKGFLPQGNACKQTQTLSPSGDYTAMGFPLDSNMINNGVPDPTVTNGNGQWACGDINFNTTAASLSTTSKGQIQIILNLASTTGISQGVAVSAANISLGTKVNNTANVTLVTSTTVTVALAKAVSVSSGEQITFEGYWNTAHPAGTAGSGNPPAGCSSAATVSRASVYQYEIDKGFTNDASVGGEVGGPTCSTSTPDNTRRFLNVAVLNCLALADEGYSLKGNSANLPVAAFAKFFLTVPVTNPQGPIYGEYGGIVTPGSDPSLRYQVQLYR